MTLRDLLTIASAISSASMEISSVFLFCIGLAVGSFINVLSLRYDPDRPIFSRLASGGRSRCMHCDRALRWFELIPLLSFLVLFGRCRTCRGRLSLQYPVVELVTGLTTAFIPIRLFQIHLFDIRLPGFHLWFYLVSAAFILAAFTMIFLSAVDARLKLIPDQSNLLIVFLGLCLTVGIFLGKMPGGSFLEHYALLFGFQDNVLINRLIGALFGLLFFGAIVYFTRGRGMGLGDVKLAGALGLLLGWPDIALTAFLAFILGALSGILLLIRRTKTMQSVLPFGPFIVLGAFLVFFYGSSLMRLYFTLFP